MTLENRLISLGLHPTEAKFYLAALELGQASVREIAAKACISRTNAYDVVSRLAEQGLVRQLTGSDSRTMLVAAENPEHLVGIFEERRRLLASTLPELRSLHNLTAGKPRVRFYEGVEGIKTVLDEAIQTRGKTVLAILSMRDLYEVPGRAWMDDHVRRRIENGVHLRVIRSAVNDVHPNWDDNAAELRSLRFAPRDMVLAMTTYISEDRVASISTRRENFAMTIESAEHAATQRHMFEALWAISSPAVDAHRKSSVVVSLRPSKRRNP